MYSLAPFVDSGIMETLWFSPRHMKECEVKVAVRQVRSHALSIIASLHDTMYGVYRCARSMSEYHLKYDHVASQSLPVRRRSNTQSED